MVGISSANPKEMLVIYDGLKLMSKRERKPQSELYGGHRMKDGWTK